MIDNKPFAMFFNASPRKGWNTHKMLKTVFRRRACRRAQGDSPGASRQRGDALPGSRRPLLEQGAVRKLRKLLGSPQLSCCQSGFQCENLIKYSH